MDKYMLKVFIAKGINEKEDGCTSHVSGKNYLDDK
jgi:hypothetical protein